MRSSWVNAAAPLRPVRGFQSSGERDKFLDAARDLQMLAAALMSVSTGLRDRPRSLTEQVLRQDAAGDLQPNTRISAELVYLEDGRTTLRITVPIDGRELRLDLVQERDGFLHAETDDFAGVD